MPVKHYAEGGIYWNPTRPGVPQVAALLGNSPVRFVSSSWLASVHLPRSPLCNFFLLFGNGMSTELLFFVILSVAMPQTSDGATSYLPPCCENSQSIPGWLWTAFYVRWLPRDIKWAEEEGIFFCGVLENQLFLCSEAGRSVWSSSSFLNGKL